MVCEHFAILDCQHDLGNGTINMTTELLRIFGKKSNIPDRTASLPMTFSDLQGPNFWRDIYIPFDLQRPNSAW